uniref:USP domain-containing protein n=1 Tax=Vitis vinifera TaxID=29760 RepID=F6HV75_VITVI
MGWKKRGGGLRSKNLPTPSPAADKAVEEEKTEAHITSEIARAEKTSERGNHRRALMIMKELSSRNPSSAQVHFSHAGLICTQAKSMKDPTAKKRYLKNALEPVQRAMSLDPDELKYFCFYPSLIFDLASHADAYREVMQVVGRTRQRLQERGLVRGILDKHMEALFLCSRYIVWQLEQKNVNFDDEQFKHKYMANAMRKMKQIKAKSEAVRVTQKTLQSMDFQEDFQEEEEMTLGARILERRKTLTNIKKLTALGDKITQVQGYWNSLSADTQRGFLKVRICDLKEHFIRFANNDLAVAVLSEAIGFLQENDSWKFMECCVCAEKFTDLLLYAEHFAEHMGGLSERLSLFQPQEIDSDWVDIIEKGGWKPEDARAVLQISEDELKRKSSSHVECTVMDMDVHLQNCIKDPRESYSVEEMKKQFDEMLMEAEIGNQNDEKSGNHEPEGSEWPLPDYPRRAKTLAKIQGMLQMLLKGRYLSRTHVLQVIRYTLEELQIFASELQLRNLGLDNTLLGICLLEFPQLEKVLRFLHSIAYICGITKFPEEGGAPAGAQKSEIKETIGVSIDSSYLLLDERLVTGELDVSTSNNSNSNEGSGSTFSLEDHDDDTLPGGGIFVPWLFVGRSIEEKLESWACLLDDRKHKKIEVHVLFQAHLEDLTDKDATEKALAAEEALLADLALDAEKSVDRGDGKEKQTEKKSKNKKKNKYYRKSEDLKQNKLGERIEQHSSDETAIGTISPGGLQKQESSSAAEQKTTSTDEVPLILPLLYEKLGEGKFVSSKGSDDGSNEANYETYHNFAESSEGVPQGGAGLENYANDCSLNAIIQSLWHLRWFRRELMKSAAHLHMIDEACVYCSLNSIFSLLNSASISSHKKAISPGPLRDALSNLDPQSNLYKKGEMNDASEILHKILEGLHLSFSTKKEESNGWESWDHLDCPSDICITHSLFGIKIRERVACYHCGCESRQHGYNSLFHLINASELRKKKITHMDSSFDNLLKLVKMDDQVTCNPEEGGCGKLNSIDQILSDPPHLFVVLLGWQSVSENSEDVSTTLAALTTEIDIAVIYGDLDEGRKYHLISMVNLNNCFNSELP